MSIANRNTPVVTLVTSGTATWVVTMPTGVVSGDVCLIEATDGTFASATWVPPTGFVLLKDQNNTNNIRTQVWRKVCDGTEGSTVTFTITGGATPFGQAVAIAYSGVDNTTPEDLTSTGKEPGTVTNPSQTSQTTVTDNAMVVGFFGARGAGVGSNGAAGSSATEEVDSYNTTLNSIVYVEQLVKTAAGAVALTFTFDNTAHVAPTLTWECVQVALRPSTAAPANTVAPAITGTPAVGQTLTTTDGTWTGS